MSFKCFLGCIFNFKMKLLLYLYVVILCSPIFGMIIYKLKEKAQFFFDYL